MQRCRGAGACLWLVAALCVSRTHRTTRKSWPAFLTNWTECLSSKRNLQTYRRTGAHPHARSLSLELPSPGSRLGRRGGGLFFCCCGNNNKITLCNDDRIITTNKHRTPLVFGTCDRRCGGIRRREYGTRLLPFVSACGVAHGCGVCGSLFYRPPCSRSERSEASVAARGGGYQGKRACVISGDNSGCKTPPVLNRFFTMTNL